MGERTVRLPATGVRWTAVVAVLGEDTEDGRCWSPLHPWTLRPGAPLLTLPPDRRPVGTVDHLEVRDGLVHARGTVADPDAAAAMFGDHDRLATLFPAVDLDQLDPRRVRLVCGTTSYPWDDAPVEVFTADGAVMEFQGGTVVAVTLTTDPSWPGRVQFREATDG